MLVKILVLWTLVLVASAQAVPEGVKYDLTGLIYPRVAHLARVQGMVGLQLTPTETGQQINLLKGSAMLARGSSDNLAKWRTNKPLTVNYIFKLRDPDLLKVRVPRGDAFDRLILRLLHLATYTEVSQCRQSSTEARITGPAVVQNSPLIMEVEITAPVSCVRMETSVVASR